MIRIKKAGPEDLDELAVLFDSYRQFYKQQPDKAAAKEFLRQRMLNKESVLFIAFDDEAAVGFTQLYPIFTSVGLAKAWLLNDLFVHTHARKKGIASLLLEAAKECGRHTASKWLLLETAPDNLSAQALYEKNGWQKAEDVFYQYDL
jgi:GNAT superfamily N-acetyltransferase